MLTLLGARSLDVPTEDFRPEPALTSLLGGFRPLLATFVAISVLVLVAAGASVASAPGADEVGTALKDRLRAVVREKPLVTVDEEGLGAVKPLNFVLEP